MDISVVARAEAYPVFILPGALNACAEEVGRALAELLLHGPPAGAMPGPVFVIDGGGLVDLRETIADSMHGRMFAPGHPWRTREAGSARPGRWRIVGEGLAADAGRATPLFVEVDGAGLAAPPDAGPLGMLVRCRDPIELLTLASGCAGASGCYVHAGLDDAPLAAALARLLERPSLRLTIAAEPIAAAWPGKRS